MLIYLFLVLVASGILMLYFMIKVNSSGVMICMAVLLFFSVLFIWLSIKRVAKKSSMRKIKTGIKPMKIKSRQVINPKIEKANDSGIQSVMLRIMDCQKCSKYKNRRECERYLEILELVKAMRRQALENAYPFKVINTEKQYLISIDDKRSISVENIEVNEDGIQKEEWKKLVYQIINYKNGAKRLIIIDDIKVI